MKSRRFDESTDRRSEVENGEGTRCDRIWRIFVVGSLA